LSSPTRRSSDLVSPVAGICLRAGSRRDAFDEVLDLDVERFAGDHTRSKHVAGSRLEFELAEAGFGEFKLETRTGDMLAPRVISREPLHVEIEHFVECVATGARPETDARHGRDEIGRASGRGGE